MAQSALLSAQAPRRISSFDQKPAKGGTPAMASQPMMKVTEVIGMNLRRPPIRRMSCSPSRPWITDPDPRNSSALKKACVTMWNTAATYAPVPTARNM
jgi:hypothetical protein